MTDAVSAWDADRPPLASLDLKLWLLKDRITAVAKGLQTGLYVYGPGGIGKTHTVLGQLDRLGADYCLFNARMTGKGLFLALKEAPDRVFVLEDMERLTNDPNAQGVLRSALWAADGRERRVTWTTGGEQDGFSFRGGVILLANRAMAHLPELQALATRIAVYRLEVTEPEMVALIRHLAGQGYRRAGKDVLSAEACGEVAGHLLAACREVGSPPDLRLLFNAYHDFLLWESRHAHCHWHDLVTSRVREAAAGFAHEAEPESAEDKKTLARQVVREVMRQTSEVADQVKLYRERTGRSRADFFRRRREVESGEFDSEDPPSGA